MVRDPERGQAIILVLVALSVFLLGAVGLAIDASHLYAQRQMAQAAADAAAQAGILSIFDGTNTAANNNSFGTPGAVAFNCTSANPGLTPCAYALSNGFGRTSIDVVTVDFPLIAPGVPLSTSDLPAINLIRVRIARTLSTGLLRFLGPTSSTVGATATAAIVAVPSPLPILALHPTMSGSFQQNGNVTICGGSTRSIQVNSDSATAIVVNGGGLMDLSGAGPTSTTPGSCDGHGADFGAFGGPVTYPGGISHGTDGSFVQPASPINDAFVDVSAPTIPAPGVATTVPPGQCSNPAAPCATPDCPPATTCTLYSPGLYVGGLNPATNGYSFFKPGVYYLSGGGFHFTSSKVFQMAKGFPDDPVTGPGVVFYNTGNGPLDVFDITATNGDRLVGSSETSAYKGILFFQDRNSAAHIHTMTVVGSTELTGTIYLTNTAPVMRTSPSHFQKLNLSGNATITGQIRIVADAVSLGGGITIPLNPSWVPKVRQVSLIR